MPDANFRTHWQSKATASKRVYYLLSLDSKEREVFSYLSHLFRTSKLPHNLTACVAVFFFHFIFIFFVY